MSNEQYVNGDGEYYEAFVRHDGHATLVSDDGLTRQEFAAECDINVLMASYERTGVISHVASVPPQYLDVSDVPDLALAIDIVSRAEAAFMTLPASVRKEFDNDAVKFVDYAQDPANLSQMRKWGLAPPAEPADAVIPPAPATPSSSE